MLNRFSSDVASISNTFLVRRAAQDQGGLLTGKDPTEYNPADPLRLWIIQVGVIIITTQLLALILKRLRQPKVIAEVLGGILLGPTAFGAIPGFSEHIFPTQSTPFLSLVANIGLCLFLFLVGLEIETAPIKKNARSSAAIALAGISIPFGLGAALAVPLYQRFIDADTVQYTHFMLFTGVAFCITAFPVLCRILTELKLLDTTVGIIVLSAGVGNDIIGWVLLALSVALVNAGSGLTALYVLLVCIGWTLVMLFPLRYLFGWLARQTGSIENGPSVFFMTLTILTLFGSAFFTDVIGVHAIFGAFLTGLIVPREGGLAIALTEKLEDMVGVIFLPLYFTLSGLSTNLRLLNSGMIWGYVVAICSLAFIGKFGGCTLAARAIGFRWREAGTIGSLMSCKGLIELIVLNVGLSAGILTQLVFSMFVLEAITLTCMTTPLVLTLYPQEHRVRVAANGTPFTNVQGEVPDSERRDSCVSGQSRDANGWKRRFTVVLDKLEHVPGMMALTQIIQPPPPAYTSPEDEKAESGVHGGILAKRRKDSRRRAGPVVDALRLIELNRTSEVMKASAADQLVHTDPILSIFRMFGELNGLPVSSSLAIVPRDDLATSVGEHARAVGAHLVLVPWLPPSHTTHDPVYGQQSAEPRPHPSTNPFDALFRSAAGERSAAVQHSQFVRGVFSHAGTDVALFVDRTRSGMCTMPGSISSGIDSLGGGGGDALAHRLFLPFFGGPDDRLALDFVVQLCANPHVSATIVRVVKRDVSSTVGGNDDSIAVPSAAHLSPDRLGAEPAADSTIMTVNSANAFPDTFYDQQSPQARLQSETADSVAWDRYAAPEARATAESTDAQLARALSRIEFQELATPVPLHAVVQHSDASSGSGGGGEGVRRRVLVVLGRSRRMAVDDHHAELREMAAAARPDLVPHADVRKTLGDVATAFLLSDVQAGIVVMQAAGMAFSE